MIPEDLVISQIDVNPGATWVPEEVYVDFLKHLGLKGPAARYNEKLGAWRVDADDDGAEARIAWGTTRVTPRDILNALMNGAPSPRVYDQIDRDTRVFNEEATEEAQLKYEAVAEEFQSWIESSPELEDRLAREYNDKMRRYRDRVYDGDYLTTPGVATGWKWRPYQKRVIARIVLSGNTYMAHAVGAGKTSAMIASAMEMRRLGLVKKPMFVVPNPMLRQFSREFLMQYPTARIAVADDFRFHTSRRKQFVADISVDPNLDAVIITKDAFRRLPVSLEFEGQVVGEQIEEYREIIRELEGDTDPAARIFRGRLQSQIERLEQRLTKAEKIKRDDVMSFEETGVDMMFIDEAQQFRKLSFATKMQMKNIAPEGSQRSQDLFLKIQYINKIRPGHGIVFASGTPIENTMGELFSISRYLQPEALERRGVQHFDIWAKSFGRPIQVFRGRCGEQLLVHHPVRGVREPPRAPGGSSARSPTPCCRTRSRSSSPGRP